jgi:hypothetical protein
VVLVEGSYEAVIARALEESGAGRIGIEAPR